MRNQLPTYQRPFASKNDPKVDVACWDKAYDAFDSENYKTAVLHVLNYINPSLVKDIAWNDEIITIVKNQGSAEIQINITATHFSIKAPFLRINNDTNKVALMRKVAEINFNPLTLAQIHLKNNELWFEFNCPLPLAQPNKIYDVIREICLYADDYDDEFVEDYAANFYHNKIQEPLTNEQYEQVWQQFQTIFKEFESYIAYFEEQRMQPFMWDISVISILKMANMPYVHGTLRTLLNEYVYNMYNGNIDFNLRINKTKVLLRELSQKPKDAILKDIYHAETLISLRWRSSDKIIKEQASYWEKHVSKYEQTNDKQNLCFYLVGCLLKLMYDFNLEEIHKNAIENTLEKISGKTYDVAAPILVDLFDQLVSGSIKNIPNTQSTTIKKEKGFFAKLFN